jgi:uncharacterized protein YjbI with pentapeptide repeats
VANPEHIATLKRSVAEWNVWREEILRDHTLTQKSADLSGADLRLMDLRRAILFGANLERADVREADLRGADLREVNLRWTDLSAANLSFVDLRRSNLSGANLSWADLSRANLRGADVSRANVSRANLREANLSETNLSEANFTDVSAGWTIFGAIDLSVVAGLDTISHSGPSTIGVDTIYKSGGQIPEAFLRGAGVPDNFIRYIGSLVGKPIEFYSCFISYSTTNQEFANRLHADLQGKGVRCWFAPEDLKIGDKFRDRIDESIRLHDKLLIVLSEHSIASAWVRREVEAAFEREDRQKSTVLFPIRLDDAVMETKEAWAADIRRTRYIGDFSRWKDHDSYQKALERLLRDLKAEAQKRERE